MTLLNYSECRLCKQIKPERKLLLLNIFPANICNNIIDNELQCFQCNKLMDEETEFKKQYYTIMSEYLVFYGDMPERIDRDLTTGEKQILFLKTYSKVPMRVVKMSIEERKKEIHVMLRRNGHQDKSDKFAKLQRSATIAFMQENHKVSIEIIKILHQSEHLKRHVITIHMLQPTYTYRNREYNTLALMQKFVNEYINQLIDPYKRYCDIDSLNKWSDRAMMKTVIP